MKIVSFSSGLGNQIFQYSFYLFLKKKMPNEKIYGYYNRKWLNKHNGLEIQKVFNVDLPHSNKGIDVLVFLIRIFRKLTNKIKFPTHDDSDNNNSIFFDGWWQDSKYIVENLKKLKFNTESLNTLNIQILEKIIETESVSLHIRRGDYLDSNVIQLYGNICTKEYYFKSIDMIKVRMHNPHFFIFSDDIEWAKNNLQIENANFITWNNGNESYVDMYLMSCCKANIIANSTFSFWGAYLNNRKEMIIYPKKWFNYPNIAPNIFPNEWIGI